MLQIVPLWKKGVLLWNFHRVTVRNEEVRRRAGLERELASRADQKVMRWFGHVERMDELASRQYGISFFHQTYIFDIFWQQMFDQSPRGDYLNSSTFLWISTVFQMNAILIKLNFTSILVGILHLGWLTMTTISKCCCFVDVIFSYSHRVSLLALQTLRLAYSISPRVLGRCSHSNDSMNVPSLWYYTTTHIANYLSY